MSLTIYPSRNDLLESITQCSFCSDTFSNASARRLHEIKRHNCIKKVEDIRLKCPRIQSLPSTSKESFLFCCPEIGCDKSYSSKKLITQHYRKVHGTKDEICSLCGLSFALKRDRVYHEKKRCPRRVINNEEKVNMNEHMNVESVPIQRERRTTIKDGSSTIIIMEGVQQEVVDRVISCLNPNHSLSQPNCISTQTEQEDLLRSLSTPEITDSMCQTMPMDRYESVYVHETRHVETSMDPSLEDLRHIETQTLPLWDHDMHISNYWR